MSQEPQPAVQSTIVETAGTIDMGKDAHTFSVFDTMVGACDDGMLVLPFSTDKTTTGSCRVRKSKVISPFL